MIICFLFFSILSLVRFGESGGALPFCDNNGLLFWQKYWVCQWDSFLRNWTWTFYISSIFPVPNGYFRLATSGADIWRQLVLGMRMWVSTETHQKAEILDAKSWKETKERRYSLKQQGDLLQPSFRPRKVSNAEDTGESQSFLRMTKLSYSCLEYFGFHLLANNKEFVCLIISFVLSTIGSPACIMYFNARGVFAVGLSQMQGSYSLSAIGVGIFIGRAYHNILLAGILLDWKWTKPSTCTILFGFVAGIVLALYPFSHCLVSMLLCAFMFGLSNGPYPSLQLMILREVLSPGEVGAAFTLVFFFNGFSSTLGLYIMGE